MRAVGPPDRHRVRPGQRRGDPAVDGGTGATRRPGRDRRRLAGRPGRGRGRRRWARRVACSSPHGWARSPRPSGHASVPLDVPSEPEALRHLADWAAVTPDTCRPRRSPSPRRAGGCRSRWLSTAPCTRAASAGRICSPRFATRSSSTPSSGSRATRTRRSSPPSRSASTPWTPRTTSRGNGLRELVAFHRGGGTFPRPPPAVGAHGRTRATTRGEGPRHAGGPGVDPGRRQAPDPRPRPAVRLSEAAERPARAREVATSPRTRTPRAATGRRSPRTATSTATWSGTCLTPTSPERSGICSTRRRPTGATPGTRRRSPPTTCWPTLPTSTASCTSSATRRGSGTCSSCGPRRGAGRPGCRGRSASPCCARAQRVQAWHWPPRPRSPIRNAASPRRSRRSRPSTRTIRNANAHWPNASRRSATVASRSSRSSCRGSRCCYLLVNALHSRPRPWMPHVASAWTTTAPPRWRGSRRCSTARSASRSSRKPPRRCRRA